MFNIKEKFKFLEDGIDFPFYNDIPAYLDVNNFFGGHFAIFGNSGSGKQ